jgi:hypothetical protein
VRVGYCTFYVDVSNHADALGEFGHMNIANARIRLSPNQDRLNLANTFLHECLHAIHWVYGLHDDSTEEEFTNQGTNGLCAFIQDNPEAWAWINEQLAVR